MIHIIARLPFVYLLFEYIMVHITAKFSVVYQLSPSNVKVTNAFYGNKMLFLC